ncbi:putative pilus assembly protein [Halobacteriovorax marinus SJ]|uniref:Pilus assembly protein n=1 Tax=Halobacteriovorax marinus (strain ATCC BAA-682 / DSM 15412 / SJ) TaxID=862908 RepID=E1X2B3_HALMS|nr:type IV pilus secretin PilQ [Halobacteriovorax marinus]CBW25069.1 putative pilus assembly protein [Halobacteriovorax marinus SJ]
MKLRSFLFKLVLVNLLLSSGVWATTLEQINFKLKDEVARLELKFDGNEAQAKKFHVTEDKQIIIDLKDVQATDRVMRAFDTSEFSGSIVFVSAYRKSANPNDLRIAIQLRDNVRSLLKREPNKIVIEVESRFGVFSQRSLEETKTYDEKITIEERAVGKLSIPKSDSVEDILENLTLSGRKKYIGKKITFNIKDLAVADILNMIADASGFNIILTDEVKGLPPLSLNLTNIPWDQALDTILGLNKLVAKKNGVILMITTFEKAAEEQKKAIEQKKLTEKEVPLVTKVFPISYATTKELIEVLNNYITERGTLNEDVRTNSLIVKDTADTIERIKKIVDVLDTQTPQVLIESKIVEVNENYRKEIGLQNGVNFGYDPIGQIGSANPTVVGSDVLPGTNAGPGFSFSSAPSSGDGARSLFGLTVTRFNRLLNLSFTLQLLETESKGKIVASPKVITQNKKKAVISTKETTSFSKSLSTNGQAQEITFEEAEASLSLEVTPQVTNEGSISLELDLLKQQFGTRPSAAAPPDKQERRVTTNVLVDNGSTIVIGGVYNYEKRESHSGVPFLKDIPLVGWLFRTPYAPEVIKQELLIFLTPRIVNQEEAGIIENS